MSRNFKFKVKPQINQDSEPYKNIESVIEAIVKEQSGSIKSLDQMKGVYKVFDDGNKEHICTGRTNCIKFRDETRQEDVPDDQTESIIEYHPKPTDNPVMQKELAAIKAVAGKLSGPNQPVTVWP